MMKKKKNKATGKVEPFSIDEWITITTSLGLSAEKVSEISGFPVPGSLHREIAERQEKEEMDNQKKTGQAAVQYYDSTHLAPTDELYHHPETERAMHFEGTVLSVIPSASIPAAKKGATSDTVVGVILDKTAFYPLSGGQACDLGTLSVGPLSLPVLGVEKVGPCVVHFVETKNEDKTVSLETGMLLVGDVDEARRTQLMVHHSAAHVIHHAAREVLGPHVWQQGAKKDVTMAHLDVTHYQAVTLTERLAIEKAANRFVRACHPVTKTEMAKDEAEKAYGFSLYQGGVVPGSEVRVVNMGDQDVEACCGTHVSTTGEIGSIRVLRSNRLSDGVVRLYFVAGDAAADETAAQACILDSLQKEWGVEQQDILMTADRFFDGYKVYGRQVGQLRADLASMRVQAATTGTKTITCYAAEEPNPQLYI
ncbi:hypothetical protein KIPB_012061, partial [Kipferlia bialata]|eukprot:g12061.t1